MIGPVELVLVLLIGGVIGAPVLALLSIRRAGRGWARARLISYALTGVLYAINSVALFSRGNVFGGWISAMIAWVAGKGALSAWRAWKSGDYRPAYLRVAEPA